MRVRQWVALSALALTTSAIPFVAQATMLIECKGAEGYSYFHQGLLITQQNAKFKKDNVAESVVRLVQTPRGFDLEYERKGRDARSVSGGGGSVVVEQVGEGEVSVLVTYPGESYEVYFFRFDETGKGGMSYSQMRWAGLISRHSVFASDKCVASRAGINRLFAKK
jgi:hypothetical protein